MPEMLATLRKRNGPYMTNPNEKSYSQLRIIPLNASDQERTTAVSKVVVRLEKDLKSNYLIMYHNQLIHALITQEEYDKKIGEVARVAKIGHTGIIYEALMSQKVFTQEEVPSYA